MAVVLLMIGLAAVSCKKENGTDAKKDTGITQNPIYDAFSISKDFIGKDENYVISALEGKGFTFAATGGVYMKSFNSYFMQTTYKLNASNKLYYFSINITTYDDTSNDQAYVAMLTGDYVKDAVTNKIGDKYNISSYGVRFWRTYDNLMQPRAETFSAFNSVVDDNRLHDTQTIWLENNIDHYIASDESQFIGVKMKAERAAFNYTKEQEYSITFEFCDNTAK